MAKKITIRLDDEIAQKINELARKTQIPKARLTKQAYLLLFACYQQLSEQYKEQIVNLNLINLLNNDTRQKKD
jgi:predicted transcriptional regulator